MRSSVRPFIVLALFALTSCASQAVATDYGGETTEKPTPGTQGATTTLGPGTLPANKTDICHKTGPSQYIEISIALPALQAHLAHGDIWPVPPTGCPDFPPPDTPPTTRPHESTTTKPHESTTTKPPHETTTTTKHTTTTAAGTTTTVKQTTTTTGGGGTTTTTIRTTTTTTGGGGTTTTAVTTSTSTTGPGTTTTTTGGGTTTTSTSGPTTTTTVPATTTTLPSTFSFGGATTVCRSEVPTIVIDFALPGFPSLSGRVGILTMSDVNGNVVSSQELVYQPGAHYELLYPGTRVNPDGSIADVPGWNLTNAGLWVRDPSDEFLREGIVLTFTVNPTATALVTYPPESSVCANPENPPGTPSVPPGAPPAGPPGSPGAPLPPTGNEPWTAAVAALVLAAGAGLSVIGRRRRA